MKKTILLINILGLLLSCEHKKKEPKADSELEIVEKKAIKQMDSFSPIQYIENDSIIHSWIIELTRISKIDSRFRVEKELRPNRHWDYMDTIKTLTYHQSRLTILSTEGYYGLWTAELQSPEIPLWNYIKVGMTKQQLEKTMGTKILSTKVEIGNLEQTTVAEFEFKKDKLNRIYVVGFED